MARVAPITPPAAREAGGHGGTLVELADELLQGFVERPVLQPRAAHDVDAPPEFVTIQPLHEDEGGEQRQDEGEGVIRRWQS